MAHVSKILSELEDKIYVNAGHKKYISEKDQYHVQELNYTEANLWLDLIEYNYETLNLKYEVKRPSEY